MMIRFVHSAFLALTLLVAGCVAAIPAAPQQHPCTNIGAGQTTSEVMANILNQGAPEAKSWRPKQNQIAMNRLRDLYNQTPPLTPPIEEVDALNVINLPTKGAMIYILSKNDCVVALGVIHPNHLMSILGLQGNTI
jgi:hypothetical protein